MVIAASGDLDLVSRALLDAAIDSTIAGAWPVVVVDLAHLVFVDVVGASPLHRLVAAVGDTRTIVMVNASPAIEYTLRLLDLGPWIVPLEQLPIASDEEIAAALGLS